MKILHCATSLNGGAGIAARRIVTAQVENGINSKLCAATGSPKNLMSHELLMSKSLVRKFQSKSLTFAQTNLVQKEALLVTPFSTSILSANSQLFDSVDVVHIHSFYNMLNLKEIAVLSQKKKIFVTLHDERFYTGGCHYTYSCEGFLSGCFRCPQAKNLMRKIPEITMKSAMNSWKRAESVTFIAPSKWLAEKAQRSPLLRESRVIHIPNPVPVNFFFDKDKPGDKPGDGSRLLTIGFISENLNNPYKGIEILRSALSQLENNKSVILKLFGSGSPGKFSSNVRVESRRFTSSEEAQSAISECDLIIVPSTQDNSPSVIAESLMCGVPVLGSRTGGITEVVDEFNLPSFAAGSSVELAQQVSQYIPSRISEGVLLRIRQKYSYEVSARQHKFIYENH